MVQHLGRLLSRAGTAVLDLVLPPHCACCDGPVGAIGQLCAACFAGMGFVADPTCTRCGIPFQTGERAHRGACERCLAAPPPWHRARAALIYDDHARRLILPLKHGDRTENAAVLGFHMARAGARLLEGADLLVPVPLHRWRLLRRRYNQAALLAQDIAKRARRPAVLDALRRVRHTAMLADLSAAGRLAALDGAIAVRETRLSSIAGRRVLLIDDVLTSGATAGACTRALLDAGASSVDVLVASRVRMD